MRILRQGFTLLEVLSVVAVLSLVVVLAAGGLANAVRGGDVARALASLQNADANLRLDARIDGAVTVNLGSSSITAIRSGDEPRAWWQAPDGFYLRWHSLDGGGVERVVIDGSGCGPDLICEVIGRQSSCRYQVYGLSGSWIALP